MVNKTVITFGIFTLSLGAGDRPRSYDYLRPLPNVLPRSAGRAFLSKRGI
jgi:hypothetical protein